MTALILVATLLLGLTCVLKWPSLIFNDRTLGWVANYARAKGISLSWTQWHLSIESLTFFEKHLTLEATDLCVGLTDQTLHNCFHEVTVNATLSFLGLPKLIEAGPVRLLGGTLDVRSGSQSSSEASAIAIPEWLRKARLRPIFIDIEKLSLVLGDTLIRGRASLTGTADHRSATWSLSTDSEVRSQGTLFGGRGSVTLTSTRSIWDGPWEGHLDVRGKGGKHDVVSVTASAKEHGEVALFRMVGKAKIQGKEGSWAIEGQSDANNVKAHIDGKARGIKKEITEVQINRCEVTLKKTQPSPQANLSMNCPIHVSTSLPSLPHGGPSMDFIRIFDLALKADLNSHFPPSLSAPLNGNVKVDLLPIKNDLLEGSGGVEFAVKGDLSRPPESLHLQTELKANVHLPKFESLVNLFARYPAWSIPEPINSLKGSVDVAVTGQGDLPWEMRVFPITATTRLKSPTQQVNLDSKGELKLTESKGQWTVHLGSRISLSDVRLVLPYLELDVPPRFLPDPRLSLPRAKKETAEGAVIFTYDLLVESPPAHPITLVSNLAKRPIPISVRIAVKSDTPAEITVRLDSFPVEVFRRQALVESFQVTTAPNRKDLNIKGSLRVSYTDYTIHIQLSGTAANPDIQMTSSPPLNKNEILSVLLFGKRLQELESTETESIGSAKAAITDGAVSLASMYLLASTPVESVGYNPNTQMFTAKVRLADGTSLNIGSDFGNQSRLGVRQRLGPNWSINTYLLNPFDSLHRTLNAFLEWNRRY
jgi:hypothetical protein